MPPTAIFPLVNVTISTTNLWLQSSAAQTLDPYPVLDPCGSAVSTSERVLAP
jgi:hypothetical protein